MSPKRFSRMGKNGAVIASVLVLGVLSMLRCPRTETHGVVTSVAGEVPDAAIDARDAATDARMPSPLELALDDQPPYGNDVRRAVCGTRKDCRVVKITPAGTAKDGRTRELVSVAPFAADAAAKADPDRNYDDATIEQWLLFRRAGTLVGRQWLIHDFEYEYSAVEDRPLENLVLGPDKIRYTERWKGLSRFTGSFTTEIDLERLEITRAFGVSYDKLEGETHSEYDADYDSLRLRHTHYEPNCALPTLFDEKTGMITRVRPTLFTVDWDAIPVTDVHDIGDPEAIDACAPLFDGAHAGFVGIGKVDAVDGSFRALLSDDSLYVDVTDDVVTDLDVLEVWTVPESPHPLLRCDPAMPTPKTAAGTEIRLATGATKSLAGSVPVGIRVTRTPGHVRIVVPLVVVHDTYWTTWPSLALVLRDSDDGKTVERVVSTTKGFHRKPVELAEVGSIGCARTATGLVRTHVHDELRPLIGDTG